MYVMYNHWIIKKFKFPHIFVKIQKIFVRINFYEHKLNSYVIFHSR